jgi:putative DNA primase/helicase
MMQPAIDPFAPLEPVPLPLGGGAEDLIAIVPVPDHAPEAGFRHPRYGESSATWAYRDHEGRLLGHVARFETPEGKQILPRSWCRVADGPPRWCWKSLPSPRPLYGLDRLARRPEARILIVEGEKTSDAAQERFPEYVVVTWPGGSKAVGKVDWSPLRDRDVVVWPDADAPGRKAAIEIAILARTAGARTVATVSLPGDLPEGWDLADPVPSAVDPDALLASASPACEQSVLPSGYAMGALAAHIGGSLKAAAMREHGASGQADPFKAAIRRILDVEVLEKKKERPGGAVEVWPSH